jgi:hypothetical protein
MTLEALSNDSIFDGHPDRASFIVTVRALTYPGTVLRILRGDRAVVFRVREATIAGTRTSTRLPGYTLCSRTIVTRRTPHRLRPHCLPWFDYTGVTTRAQWEKPCMLSMREAILSRLRDVWRSEQCTRSEKRETHGHNAPQ